MACGAETGVAWLCASAASRWAGWELRGHLRTRTVVSPPAPRTLAFSRTRLDWRLTERRNGAPLGLHPVLQAAERLVLV